MMAFTCRLMKSWIWLTWVAASPWASATTTLTPSFFASAGAARDGGGVGAVGEHPVDRSSGGGPGARAAPAGGARAADDARGDGVEFVAVAGAGLGGVQAHRQEDARQPGEQPGHDVHAGR